MQFRSKKNSDIHLDLAALIDVVLLVLIFLMVTTSFVKIGALQVSLPKTDSVITTKTQTEPPLIISISHDGKYFIDGKAVESRKDTLKQLIFKAFKVDKNRLVQVTGDSETSLQRIVDVMALLQQVGFKRVQILTQIDQKIG